MSQYPSDRFFYRLALAFFFITLLAGLMGYRSYGVSWDEPMQRDMGNLCYDYVTGNSDAFFSIQNKYHNATWEFINVLPERLFHLTDYDDIYASRHLLNFLVFWIASIFFYQLAYILFRQRSWALLAVVILFLTPRIFAHSFYNSKDLPFLSFFIISIYAGVVFIRKPSWKSLLFLSIASGALFGMRILGILVPFLVGGFFLFNIFTGNIRVRDLRFLAGYMIAYPVFLYAFLPVLWPDPIFHIQQAFSMHSHFPYEDPVLFMGNYLNPQHLPWYYVPVWMAVSIPFLWQIMFAVGLVLSFGLFLRNYPGFFRVDWGIMLCAVWCVTPWLMVVLLHSHIYDEWRHLFFIYPAFVLIGVFGAKTSIELIRKYAGSKLRFVLFTLFYISLIWQISVTGLFMVRNHPYQFVYFNFLAGNRSTIHLRYEMDYWGLSYKQAWEYFFRHLPSDDVVKVEWQNNPGEFNLLLFNEGDKKHIQHVDYLSCQYFFTNYRWYPTYNYREKYYSLEVDGIEIMTIFVNNAVSLVSDEEEK